MPIIRAQSILPYGSLLPEDVAVNTFHFLTSDTGDATVLEIHDALSAFYSAFDQYLNQAVLTQPRTTKFYDLSEPAPRPPFDTRTQTMVYGTAAGYPEECCIVLSFQGQPVAGVPQARRRGRVYLGPLVSSAGEADTWRHRVTLAARTAIAAGAQAMLTASLLSTNFEWVVYSPTSVIDNPSAESWVTPVIHGWVDDAFDTQRRRGPKAKARQPFGALA